MRAWSLLGGFLVGRLFGQAEGPQLRHLFRSFLPRYILFLQDPLFLLLGCGEPFLGLRFY